MPGTRIHHYRMGSSLMELGKKLKAGGRGDVRGATGSCSDRRRQALYRSWMTASPVAGSSPGTNAAIHPSRSVLFDNVADVDQIKAPNRPLNREEPPQGGRVLRPVQQPP